MSTKIMGELGHDLSDEVRLAIRGERRRNRSEHLPYEQYYDAESIALVEEKECYLMRKFGYTFIDSA